MSVPGRSTWPTSTCRWTPVTTCCTSPRGALVYAGLHLHETGTRCTRTASWRSRSSIGGTGTHHCLAGRRELSVGDVMLLRPGVWHGYEDCQRLELYNCCFSSELLRRELAWTREDPMLGYLLWSGPYSAPGRGVLSLHLEQAALDRVRDAPGGADRAAVLLA